MTEQGVQADDRTVQREQGPIEQMARWNADRLGVSFDDCDREEQLDRMWEAEQILTKAASLFRLDPMLSMAAGVSGG